MRRGLWAFLLGVGVPAILLGAGWMSSSFREREAVEREQLALMEKTGEAISGAIDASLEELRAREDARPFYLYNRYYSPPDVLAVNDPVAISPLARDPEDPRVLGYFQIDPDGTVRTPYSAVLKEEALPERARRVMEAVKTPELSGVREQAGGNLTNTTLVPTVPDAGPALSPEGPLTVSLNRWSQTVYDDVVQAQQGDLEASSRVQARGRQAPLTRRVMANRDDLQQNTVVNQVAPEPAPPRPAPPRPVKRRVIRRAPPAPPPEPVLPMVNQETEDIDYTPMAWESEPGRILMHRVVSHESTNAVQGLVLEGEYLITTWVPRLVEQLAIAGPQPELVPLDEPHDCALRVPASNNIPTVDLCFPRSQISSRGAAADQTLMAQVGALFGLFLIMFVSGWVLFRAARRSEALSRQKSEFVTAVSHELRTPLTTIRMHSEMLREGMVSKEKEPRFHDDLVKQSVRLSRLVENVLELSRIEEGKRPLKKRDGDLADHVRQVVEEQRGLVEEAGFRLELGPLKSPPLSFDHQAVEQIVVNLLDNAVKYGAGETNEIRVSVTETKGQAQIIIEDRGAGIPEKDRRRVFERFFRVDRKATEHKPGTGIGLSLVSDLARAHGGSAVMDKAEGGGARAVISLPVE